jgi:hypothetical protein
MAEDLRPEAAVRAAKKWLAEVYADEAIAKIGLEEVRFRDGNWEITLGFNRRDARPEEGDETSAEGDPQLANPLAAALQSLSARQRIYKVVVVAGNDNAVLEMRDREVA